MEKTLNFVTRIATWIIMALGAVLLLLVLFNSSSLQKVTEESVSSPYLNTFFILTYISLILAIVVTVLFPLINLILNPKQLVRALLILLAFAAVGFVSYLLAKMGGNDLSVEQLNRLNVTESMAMWVEASIYFTYIIFGIAILVTLYSSVIKYFKK